MAKQYPNMAGAHTRMMQEMAKLEGMKEAALADVKAAGPAGEEKAKLARIVMKGLEPDVERWVNAGMPEDDEVGQKAGTVYLAATLELRDALAGSARAEQVLEKYGPGEEQP